MVLNDNTVINLVNNNANSQSPNGITANPVSFKAGRVKNIILDSANEKFPQFGEWNGLGVIEYQDITNPTSATAIAKPYFGNIKTLPLLEEIVWIVTLPSTALNGVPIEGLGVTTRGFTTNINDYYIVPTALWNHPHHNAFPSQPNQLPESQRKDYRQTAIGNVRKVTDKSTDINLGNTFRERLDIHPLLPFEGDIIHEGRWGNSIRFGSTIKTKSPPIDSLNNWSTGTSDSGDPIIILRNGQGIQGNNGWIPITENINNDSSSIYLTSTQKIPLKASSTNYSSYTSYIPKTPNEYEGKQVIINSGRLVFNSTTDHIMLSSALTINFNAVKGFNFDTNTNFVVRSRQIKLGSKNATEPLLLGNQTVTLLRELIVNLQAFMQVAAIQVSTAPGTALGPLNTAANNMSLILQNLDADYLTSGIGDIRSKNNFTI